MLLTGPFARHALLMASMQVCRSAARRTGCRSVAGAARWEVDCIVITSVDNLNSIVMKCVRDEMFRRGRP